MFPASGRVRQVMAAGHEASGESGPGIRPENSGATDSETTNRHGALASRDLARSSTFRGADQVGREAGPSRSEGEADIRIHDAIDRSARTDEGALPPFRATNTLSVAGQVASPWRDRIVK